MSFDAGAIVGTLKLDTDPYAQGMLKAQSIARIFPETVTTFLTNPLLGVVDLLKKTGGAFISFFSDAAAHGDEMADLANSVGVGVDELTSLGQVAQLSGSSVQGLADGYRFLGKAVNEAMESAQSDAAKTFRSLGVEFLTAEGAARPLEDVFLDLSDAISALPEGGQRTSVAMSLLGRSGTELVPTLIQGSKALQGQMDQMRRYGAVVTETSADTSGRWNDAMDEMGIAWHGLKQSLADSIRPVLLPYLENLLEWTRQHQPEIRRSIVDTTQAAIDAAGSVRSIVAQVLPYITFVALHAQQLAGVAAGVAAYMAGPAVMGIILTIGPALLSLLMPMTAVRLGITGIFTAINPLSSMTRLLSIGLGLLAATAVASPGSFGHLGDMLRAVGAAGMYVADVVHQVIVPAIGTALAGAFAHLLPYLPTASGALDTFEHVVGKVAGFVVGTVVPAMGATLAAAFDWIGPKLSFVGGVFLYTWDVMRAVIGWIVGPGVDAVSGAFAAAWAYLGQTIDAISPPFVMAYDIMAGVVTWIMGTAVPSIGEAIGTLWGIVAPFYQAVGGFLSMLYTDMLAPLVTWVVTVADPAILGVIASVWGAMQPAVSGMWVYLKGLWDVGAGLVSWLVAAGSVGVRIIAADINGLTAVMRGVFNIIGWGWSNVLQPVYAWVWSVVKPGFEFIGNLIGGLLEKVGRLLSWLGSVIDLSGQATAAVNKVPSSPASPANAPAAAAGVLPPTSSTPSIIPRFDAAKYGEEFKSLAGGVASAAAGGIGQAAESAGAKVKAGIGDLKIPELKLPEFKLPEFKLPGLPTIAGIGNGIDRSHFDDLKRGTAAVADDHAAGKQGVTVDEYQQRRAFEQTKGDYNDRIRDALHNRASTRDVEALRDEKEAALRKLKPTDDRAAGSGAGRAGGQQTPAVNVTVPPISEEKLARIVIDGVTYEMSKQVGRAVAVTRSIGRATATAGGL